MKRMFNLVTHPSELSRFADTDDLLAYMGDLDGVEVMAGNGDDTGILPTSRIIGLHMRSFITWLDLWRGDEEALVREFGSMEVVERHFGGIDRSALVRCFREDLARAHRFGAGYVVFHVSESYVRENFTFRYEHTDEEVVDAACELLNEVFADEDGSIALLLENLWQPGLTFTNPQATRRLLEGVAYPNTGIMLDTGHLAHTDFSLRTLDEVVDYVLRRADEHGDLCECVRGMHLNCSLTGQYCARIAAAPPQLPEDFEERYWGAFEHAFAVDRHEPFDCPRVREVVERFPLEYLTFEFITESREQHRSYLDRQLRALKGTGPGSHSDKGRS